MINLNVKKDFPLLMAKPDLVYLDSAATSQKPGALMEAYNDYYTNFNANVHRGGYKLALKTSEVYEQARERVAKFISADSEEIVFVRNATEGLNLLARTFSESVLKEGGLIITTAMEHHSNLLPWLELGGDCDCEVLSLDGDVLNEQSLVDIIIERKPKVVAVSMLSNVTGQLVDIDLITQACRKVGALIVADACQLVPRKKLNVKELDVDFLVFSGHKIYGPMGIGVLFGKKELLKELPPFLLGGGMVESVSSQDVRYLNAPQRFEAGTPNVADAYVLAKVLDYLEGLDWDLIWEHDREVMEYLLNELSEIEEVRIIAEDLSLENRAGAVSFMIKGLHPLDVGKFLDSQDIAVRTGNHCAGLLMNELGCDQGTIRASIGIYTDLVDVEKLVLGLKSVIKFFKKK